MATPSKSTDIYAFQQLGEFSVGNGEIRNLLSCPDSDTAWIHSSGSQDISLVDGKGNTKQLIRFPHGLLIHQLTLGPNNDLLMTFPILKLVKEYTYSKGAFSTFTSFKETCEPRGITTVCGLLDGTTVIVGTRRLHNPIFLRRNKHKYELCQFRNEGLQHLKHKFEEGSPERLASNMKTKDIAVIAVKDNSEHSVVVLSFDMQKKLKYSKEGSTFLPTDMAFDIWNHLVICDAKSNSILLLDENGDLQRQYCVGRENIVAVGCFPSGTTWVGSGKQIKTIQYMKMLSKYEIHVGTLT